MEIRRDLPQISKQFLQNCLIAIAWFAVPQLLYYWIGGVMPSLFKERGRWTVGGDYHSGMYPLVMTLWSLPFVMEAVIFTAVVAFCQGIENVHLSRKRVVFGGLIGVALFFSGKIVAYYFLKIVGITAWLYPMGLGDQTPPALAFLYFGFITYASLQVICRESGSQGLYDKLFR